MDCENVMIRAFTERHIVFLFCLETLEQMTLCTYGVLAFMKCFSSFTDHLKFFTNSIHIINPVNMSGQLIIISWPNMCVFAAGDCIHRVKTQTKHARRFKPRTFLVITYYKTYRQQHYIIVAIMLLEFVFTVLIF